MAEIERFRAEAPRRGSLDTPIGDGGASALFRVAEVAGSIAGRIGKMADAAAIREGKEDGMRAAQGLTMPGVDFAFDKSAPATTPAADPLASPAGETSVVAAPGNSALLSYANQGATRNQPIVGRLSGRLQEAVAAVYGEGYRAEVYSGGQPAKGRRTGSVRHNHGRAADVYIYGPDGKRVTGDRLAPLGQYWAAKRYGGVGMEMRGGGIHLDDWDKPPPGGSMSWNYAGQGGRFTPAMQAAMAAGLSGRLPALAGQAAPPPAVAAIEAAALIGGEATGSIPAAAPAGNGVQVTLTGQAGALPRAKAGTLYGDAFNAAATNIYVSRLDTSMRAQMEALALQHEGQPGELQQALEAQRAGYMSELPPEAAALIGESFERTKFGLLRQATTQWRNNLESADLAATEENVSARINSAYRLASRAGTGAEADAAIAGELGALEADIDASRMTPLQKSRFKTEARNGVISARILGAFEGLKDPAARAEYLKATQEAWRAGQGFSAGLDAKAYDGVTGEMMRRVQADEVDARRRTEAVNKSINDQIGILKKGWPVSEAKAKQLTADVAKSGDATVVQNLSFLENLSAWQKAHVAARPEYLDAQIAELDKRIRDTGMTEAAEVTREVMTGLRDQMEKGLKVDPLTWANQAGVAKVEPLALTGDANALTTTLAERTKDARAIGAHYGVEPRFFTPAERDELKKLLRDNPLAMPQIVSSLSAGLGDDTPRALAEISDDAPLLAHVGGLVHLTGDQRVAVEVAEALQLRAEKGYKSGLPSPAKLQTAFADAAGPALTILPRAQAAALETAAALAETRALSRGISFDAFDAGSPARNIFDQAVDEVLGATWRDDVKFGGLTDVNGWQTVAPPDIEAEALQDMISEISRDDLLFQSAIGSANGVPVSLQQLRTGRLVMTSPGRYRIATGDVEAGRPDYVADGAGGYFELDVGMLKRSQQDRGAASNAAENCRRVIQQSGNQFDR